MCASVPEQTTYPHDYRLICESDPAPIIVGGQAINLWAISFLQPGAPDLASKVYGSKDLDILANTKVLAYLKKLPGWVYKPQSFRNWMDTRVATLHSAGPTGSGRVLSLFTPRDQGKATATGVTSFGSKVLFSTP